LKLRREAVYATSRWGGGSLPTSDSAYDGYTYSLKESYLYDEKGFVSSIVDHVTNTKTVYSYDTEDKPIQVVRFDKNGGLTVAQDYTYARGQGSFGESTTGGVETLTQTVGSTTMTYTYSYDDRWCLFLLDGRCQNES